MRPRPRHLRVSLSLSCGTNLLHAKEIFTETSQPDAASRQGARLGGRLGVVRRSRPGARDVRPGGPRSVAAIRVSDPRPGS